MLSDNHLINKKTKMKSKFKFLLLAVSAALVVNATFALGDPTTTEVWDDTLDCGHPCATKPNNICCQKTVVGGTEQMPTITIKKRKGVHSLD
jgi:hypothetical protein